MFGSKNDVSKYADTSMTNPTIGSEKLFNLAVKDHLVMFSYVFNEGKWIETEKIYPHDIVLILEPKNKKIYLWKGPRAPQSLIFEALPEVDKLKEKFEKFEYIELGDVIPMKVETEIEERIDRSFEETQKIDRAPQYFLFIVFTILGLVSAVVSYIFLLAPITWNVSGSDETIMIVSEMFYANWVSVTSIAVLVTTCIFTALAITSAFTKKIFLIMNGILAMAIQYGTYRYIRLGIYLFDFQGGASPGYYNILRSEVAIYSFLNILGFIAILVPSIISLRAIFKDTRPISFKDWLEKRKTTQVTLAKYSIIAERPDIKATMVDAPRELDQIELERRRKEKETIELKLID